MKPNQNIRPASAQIIARGIAQALALLAIALGVAIVPSLTRAEEPPPARNFYDVLEDVMGDFEFDLKNGTVGGLKDVSIRNIVVSENVPPSFKGHLELLITERILKNTKAKVVQCLPCKAKKTTLSGDQVVITSPETNPVELARIARSNGILSFMDVAFLYQPSGIVLSMTTTDPETGSINWSRSYNSEVSRAAAFRRGVDYSQTDEARRSADFNPTLQYRGTVYYLFEPNITGLTGCIGLGFRMVERYDNRKKEVGGELNFLRDASTLTGGTASTTTSLDNLYAGFNLTGQFIHAWNFIGEEENYNKIRGSLHLGIGGTYASGYLGGLARVGWEWRLGKHFSISTTAGYRPPATAYVGSFAATGKSVGGPEFGLGISFIH